MIKQYILILFFCMELDELIFHVLINSVIVKFHSEWYEIKKKLTIIL